jgi:hypothetical protein
MRAHAAQGFARSVLDVDSDSPTGALGLYEGVGFVPDTRSMAFVKTY